MQKDQQECVSPVDCTKVEDATFTPPRRGLLAALAAAATAAVAFRPGRAEAAANATLLTGSTDQFGVLASPTPSGPPILPTIGTTTHGVIGSNSSLSVAPIGSGVLGVRSGTGLAGVLGVNGGSGIGVQGVSETGLGVVGVSKTGTAAQFSNDSEDLPTLTASNAAAKSFAAVLQGRVRVKGNFSVTGAKAAVVPARDGRLVTVYCQESPEAYFEDFGRATLEKGAAWVPMRQDYADLVRIEDYMVFITPEGACEPLYVSSRETDGFAVKELRDGASDAAFSYRIVARRKDIEGERLALADPVDDVVVELTPTARSAQVRPGMSDDDVA